MLFFPTAYFQNTLPLVALNLSQAPNQLENSEHPTQTRLADLPRSQRNLIDNSCDRNNLDFINKLSDWSKRNQTTDLKRLDISGNYPEKVRAVGGPNSGTVAVAVKVDENGKIISDTLEVIGSSFPNGDFDDEALSAVRKHSFPATGKREVYMVQVQFNKDSKVPRSSILSPTPAATPNLPQNSP